MVTLFVAGQKIEWAEAEKWLADPSTETKPIELRDAAGKVVVRVKLQFAEIDPDWVKAITPEEIERRMAGPFLTLDEYRKQNDQQ